MLSRRDFMALAASIPFARVPASQRQSSEYGNRAIRIKSVLRCLGLRWDSTVPPSPNTCRFVIAIDRVVLGTSLLNEGLPLAGLFDDVNPIVPEAPLAHLSSERLNAPANIEDVLAVSDVILYEHFDDEPGLTWPAVLNAQNPDPWAGLQATCPAKTLAEWSFQARGALIERVLSHIGMQWDATCTPSIDACRLVLATDLLLTGAAFARAGSQCSGLVLCIDSVLPMEQIIRMTCERLHHDVSSTVERVLRVSNCIVTERALEDAGEPLRATET